MIEYRRIDEEVIQSAWGKENKERALATGSPQMRNVLPAVALGSSDSFRWRGKSYLVPALSWRAGLALMDARLTAQDCRDVERVEVRKRYTQMLGLIEKIIWRNCRPINPVSRLLWRLRLARNPFRLATEQEVIDLADFFLKCRMRSHVQFRPKDLNSLMDLTVSTN